MKKQKMVTGVGGLAVRKDGKILLTKRHAPGKPAWHNKWQVAGGEMEFGETPEQTLARELQEELNVSARIIFPYPIIVTKVWYGDHVDTKQDTHITLMIYLVDIGNQKVDVSGDEETNAYKWVDPKKVDFKKCLPLTDKVIVKFGEIIKNNGILEKL